ncbi:MAG: hypothetical protein LC667_20305 [Thioalkalivibrio sp.]|nr:hypothetical protein [Thioalkalivibrio sp.]
MLNLAESEIDAALARLPPGLEKYRWIQNRARRCDVSIDPAFQKRFKGFYRVRRDAAWCRPSFRLLEDAKAAPITFAEALRTLREHTGRLEASFSSKLVHTVDPILPVLDRFVLANIGLRLPYANARQRERRLVELFEELRARYRALKARTLGHRIREHFDQAFPGSGVSDLKKIDLVLWQHRSPQ